MSTSVNLGTATGIIGPFIKAGDGICASGTAN